MKKNQHKELMEKVPSGNLTSEEKLSLAKDLLSASSSEWSISHQKNFADNLLFLMSIKNNLLENENNPEILWRCIKSFGILGAKSKNQECKDFCFFTINKFKDDSNKKISYFANLEIICHFGEKLKSESYTFEDLEKFMNEFKKHDTMLMASYLVSNKLNNFSKEEIQLLHLKFHNYSSIAKKEFYKNYYMKFSELLLEYNSGKINQEHFS